MIEVLNWMPDDYEFTCSSCGGTIKEHDKSCHFCGESFENELNCEKDSELKPILVFSWRQTSPAVRTLIFFFLLLFLLIGFFLVIDDLFLIYKSSQTKVWTKTIGIINHVRISSNWFQPEGSKGYNRYFALVSYKYETGKGNFISSTPYIGASEFYSFDYNSLYPELKICSGRNQVNDRRDVERFLSALKPGTKIDVWYNPENHVESIVLHVTYELSKIISGLLVMFYFSYCLLINAGAGLCGRKWEEKITRIIQKYNCEWLRYWKDD